MQTSKSTGGAVLNRLVNNRSSSSTFASAIPFELPFKLTFKLPFKLAFEPAFLAGNSFDAAHLWHLPLLFERGQVHAQLFLQLFRKIPMVQPNIP